MSSKTISSYRFRKMRNHFTSNFLSGEPCSRRHSVDTSSKLSFEEVKIPVPWGYLAGKWWGQKTERPILGLHGWLDNAGTFDRLAPLLPKHLGFLALDLPGHGLSSRMPDGTSYTPSDIVYFMRLIMHIQKWDKVSFLNHSRSARAAYLFCASFPDKVDMMIALDSLKPFIIEPETIVKNFSSRFENFILADERNQQKIEPPSYSYDELVEKLYIGSDRSVDRSNCAYLLERNIRKSIKNQSKYIFTLDGRLRVFHTWGVTQNELLKMAEKITAPYLFIKAKGSSYYERKEYHDQVLAIMMEKTNFEYWQVDGTHHVHLNEPEKISEIVNPFINKCRPPSCV